MGAHAAVHGLTMRTVPSVNGLVDVDAYAGVVAPNAGPYLVSTAAVAVENTHNFGGGTIQPYDRLVALGELCRAEGLGYHLDGARLWNAHVATGVPLAAYGSLFDTVSVCFSKGLGAPVGSVLVSTRGQHRPGPDLAQAARRWLAAGRHPRRRRAARPGPPRRPAGRGPRAAAAFAAAVADRAPSVVDVAAVQTNIVVLDTGAVPAAQVAAAAKDQGVWVSALGPRMLRAVTHLDVVVEEARTAGEVVGSILVDASDSTSSRAANRGVGEHDESVPLRSVISDTDHRREDSNHA